jgi:hypothetical protein
MAPHPRPSYPAGARLKTKQLLVILLSTSLLGSPSSGAQEAVQASSLLDISGLAWMEDGLFVAVHDAKSKPGEDERPRVSLVSLPSDASTPPEPARLESDGIYFQNLEVAWPQRKPNDLESIARIPGTRKVLLVESGDDGSTDDKGNPFQSIFLATLTPFKQLTVDEVVPWPTAIKNVEASAVFNLEGNLYFAYAERADSQPQTEIRWAKMQLNPLRFGSFSSMRYAARVSGPGFRPIVALEVDSNGHAYAVCAYDPDDDNGPFRSVVSSIGQFRPAGMGAARFVPSGKFADIAQQDGFKIEGLALKPDANGSGILYSGTDDENFGAVLRQIFPLVAAKKTDRLKPGGNINGKDHSQ